MKENKIEIERNGYDRRVNPRRVTATAVSEERRIKERRAEPRRAFEWIDHFVDINEEPLQEEEEAAPTGEIKDLEEVAAATAAEMAKEE